MVRRWRDRTVIITFKAPQSLIDLIDYIVKRGMYSSRSEFIRRAIAEKLKKDLETLNVGLRREELGKIERMIEAMLSA